MNSLVRLLALVFILGSANSAMAHNARTVQIDRDIPYVANGDPAQRLDIYRPAINPAKAPPLLIWLHGGGWMMGSKSSCPGGMFVMAGYDVASVEYRFSTVARFPAQIQDCQAALRWLRVHHADYGFDPDRIGVIGESAGGHLAALMGTTGGKNKFAAIGENKNVSDEVKAVCDCYGPSDFTTLIPQIIADKTVHNVFALDRPTDDDSHDLFKMLTGNRVGVDPAMDAMVSPVTYIDAHDPPFLIIHGTKDNLVPVAQSIELADKLQKAGDTAVLQLIAGAGHGGPMFFDPRVTTMVKTFFDQAINGVEVTVKPVESLSGATTRPSR